MNEWNSIIKNENYLRGDLSSFLLLDFLDDTLLDDDREPRSLFELELFDKDDDDFDFELPLLPIPDLLDAFDDNLFGNREFLCLRASLFWWSIILLLLLTWVLFVVSVL